MTSVEMVKDGVAYYVDRNIMSKYPADGWQKVLAGSVAALAISNYAEKLKNSPAIKALGIVSDDGVDIDTLAKEIKRRISSSGMKVDIPMLGEAVFYETDIDDMLECIKGRR